MKTLAYVVLITALAFSIVLHAMLAPTRWNAINYQNNVEPQNEAVQKLIDNVTATFSGDESILDIGCGPGTKTYMLAQKVPYGLVYGIDSSLSMIERAQQLYGNSVLKFFHAHAESFVFGEQFDLISAFGCLHWIQDQQQVLNSIAKSLKPMGSFIATIALENPKLDQFIATLSKTALSKRWQYYMPLEFLDETSRSSFLKKQLFPLNEKKLKHMLKGAGFKLVTLKPFENSMTFSKEKFMPWLKGWLIGFSLLAEIPDQNLEEFITDFVHNYLIDNEIENNISIPYSNYIMLIQAKRIT